jgi:hypothetical protein
MCCMSVRANVSQFILNTPGSAEATNIEQTSGRFELGDWARGVGEHILTQDGGGAQARDLGRKRED